MKIRKPQILFIALFIQLFVPSVYSQTTLQRTKEPKVNDTITFSTFSPQEIMQKWNNRKRWNSSLQNVNILEVTEKTDPLTQYQVGEFFESLGSGYLSQAFKYFNYSAINGLPRAQMKIGKMYFEGIGISKNESAAKKWLTKAAQQGDAEAQFELAYLFIKEEQPNMAIKWLKLSGEQGNAKSQLGLAQIYHRGVKLDNGKVIKDLNEARKWYTLLAINGNVDGIYPLGLMFYYGDGCKQDFDSAFKWFNKGAEYQNTNCQTMLGEMYEKGLGVTKSDSLSTKLYYQAANSGNTAAQENLGRKYYYGIGVKKDYAEALKWFKQAVRMDDSYSMYHLGFMYLNGLGIPIDDELAFYWINNAAQLKDKDAEYLMGYMYENARKVSTNLTEAIKWYELSAEQGNKNSKERLDSLLKNK